MGSFLELYSGVLVLTLSDSTTVKRDHFVRMIKKAKYRVLLCAANAIALQYYTVIVKVEEMRVWECNLNLN